MLPASDVSYNSRNGNCIAYSRAEWVGPHDHLGDVLWKYIFILGASAAASKFCEWVQDGIDL